jgi:hypothetical protein
MRQLGRIAVPARVGGGAHPIVEDAVGWRLGKRYDPGVEEPFRVRLAEFGEGIAQRLHPRAVLVEDVDLAHFIPRHCRIFISLPCSGNLGSFYRIIK